MHQRGKNKMTKEKITNMWLPNQVKSMVLAAWLSAM